ncbi:MAG: carboxypeptidase regulatory-like domain-containing protein [Chitinophagaceae bacterium]
MSRIIHFVFAILALVLVQTSTSYAQVTTGSITGYAKDDKGGALVGATVEAIHTPSGTRYTTTAGKNGQYTLGNVRVGGPYSVKVTFAGLESFSASDVYVKLGEPFVLDAQLGTGKTLENVVVTAGRRNNSVLNASRTGSITNIGRQQIQTLPTIQRSINDLTRLTPQATSTSTGAIGGGNYRQNYITVDGSDFNNTFGIGTNLPANGSPISIDALEEISVSVNPYDIKQSGFVGSAVNAVTRSGTNDFSGSAYTFWRSEGQQGNKVAGNDPFLKQNLQVNTYGFRVGGPIIKNKLFFFINAEKGKTVSPGQTSFAATATSGAGSYGQTNIARPLASELDAIATYLKNTYEYDPGSYQGYDFETKNTRFVARIDWNISTKHRLSLRYSQVESNSPSFVSTSRSPLTAYSSTAGRTTLNALWFKNSNYYQDANFYSFAAELNSSFGKVSNTLRASYTHQNDPRSSDSRNFPFVDILKDGTPFTSFGYEPFTYGNLRDVTTYSVVDYAQLTTGIHNITAGLQLDIQDTKNGFQRFGTSYYTFNSWDDFVNGVKPRDYAITYSLLPGFAQAYPKIKYVQYSVYGQDEISLSRTFRLTAGLRLDLPTFPSVPEIKTHPLVAALTFNNGEKVNTGTLPKTRILWSPRIGFNWDVKGDRSVQLRGGTGIFTGRVPTVWLVAQSGDAGLLQFTQTYEGQANTPGPFNPDPAAYRPATPPAAGTAIPSTISAISKDFKFPQTWKSSLAIDVRLPWGMIGTLEGAYNKDLNVALGRNPNLVDPTPLNVTGYADNRPIYPSSNTQKYVNPLTTAGQASPTGTAAFNPVVLDNKSKGYYWSVMAKVDKQFSKGFSASFAYIHSEARNLYDGSGDQLLNTWSITQIGNATANNPAMSYANYVVPDRIVASVSYRKEYLKHLATTVSLFLEGSISGRFSYTYSSDFNRDGQTNDLIYVPKDASEITFADQTYTLNGVTTTYTAKQQSDMFFRYIEQDKYLNSRRGKYAERNGAKLPWRNQVDIRIAQDLFANIGGKRNTLQFTLDIFNFGNLLNKNWGIYKTVNTPALLTPRNVSSLVAGGTVKPTFSLAADRGVPVIATYRDNNTLTSTYYMQFGLRYIFN